MADVAHRRACGCAAERRLGHTSGVTATPKLDAAADDRANYRSLINVAAKREGPPPEITDAVMAVESGYNPGAIGTSGEIGLMQILPSTARLMGFPGADLDLAVPETSIRVEEVNRYRPGMIIVTNGDLARRVVNGTFEIDNLKDFVPQVEQCSVHERPRCRAALPCWAKIRSVRR